VSANVRGPPQPAEGFRRERHPPPPLIRQRDLDASALPRAVGRCARGVQLVTLSQRGATGAQGTPGAQGAAGPTGSAGTAGAQGPAGTNATVAGVSAGGALSGTYPNPTFAAGAVAPNSTELGGLTADQYTQGTGHFLAQSAVVNNGSALLFASGDAGAIELFGDCNTHSGGTGMDVYVQNNTGAAVPLWTAVAGSAAGEASLASGVSSTPTTALTAVPAASEVTFNALEPSGPVTITVWAASTGTSGNLNCTFSAVAHVGF
jgi:hypothetical protein